MTEQTQAKKALRKLPFINFVTTAEPAQTLEDTDVANPDSLNQMYPVMCHIYR